MTIKFRALISFKTKQEFFENRNKFSFKMPHHSDFLQTRHPKMAIKT